MGFTRLKYESENAGIIFIDVDDSIASLIGTEPTADADSSLTAYTSVSRRRNGIHARRLVLSRTRGTAPDTFEDRRELPVLTLADFAASAFQPGGTITIGTDVWNIRRQLPETAV